MKPQSHEEHKWHTFDSFCKKVLKHEARNAMKNRNGAENMKYFLMIISISPVALQ